MICLKCCILLILTGAVAVVSIRSARSAVIWTFHETSCTALNGTDLVADVRDGSARSMRLQVRLDITGPNVTGSVEASPAEGR